MIKFFINSLIYLEYISFYNSLYNLYPEFLKITCLPPEIKNMSFQILMSKFNVFGKRIEEKSLGYLPYKYL